MKRGPINLVIHALLGRRLALLRLVDAGGGCAYWRDLFAAGFRIPTLQAAVRQQYLTAKGPAYRLTKSGRNYLAATDRAAAMRV